MALIVGGPGSDASRFDAIRAAAGLAQVIPRRLRGIVAPGQQVMSMAACSAVLCANSNVGYTLASSPVSDGGLGEPGRSSCRLKASSLSNFSCKQASKLLSCNLGFLAWPSASKPGDVHSSAIVATVLSADGAHMRHLLFVHSVLVHVQ